MSRRFFSYDPDNGFEFHDTAEQAKAECEKAFGYYQDEAAGDGWPENVDQLCWGEIKEQASLIKETNRPPSEELDEDGYDAEGNDWRNGDFDNIQEWKISAIPEEDYDPTPYCAHCGAMKSENCHCGPISKDD